MISLPAGTRVWLATGHTDMRRGFDGLALLVQETLKRNPHNGHLFVFRGRRGSLIKVLWHDGQGMCLFAKRLERGRFVWPSTVPRDDIDRTVTQPAVIEKAGECPAALEAVVDRLGGLALTLCTAANVP
ncbi:MAG: IS66 family insertion sequence element accessory protein TnpB [Xanthobacteraceae bacterium]